MLLRVLVVIGEYEVYKFVAVAMAIGPFEFSLFTEENWFLSYGACLLSVQGRLSSWCRWFGGRIWQGTMLGKLKVQAREIWGKDKT